MTTPDLSDLNTYEREKLRALLAAIDPDDIPALRSMLDGHIACEAEVMSIKPRPVPTLDSAEPLACDVPCRNRLRVYQEGEPGRPGCSWVPDGPDYSCTVCGLHVPEGTRLHGLVVAARDNVEPAGITADDVHEAGVPRDRIDAGAAWDGYHLYTYGVDQGITRALTRDGPWWTFFYGKATDSTYVISGRPLEGYRVVSIRSYPATLQEKPTNLYLLQRAGT